MPVIVYGPIPCLLRAVHWVRLANEPRVTFAAAVDSKTGVNALTGADNPRIDRGATIADIRQVSQNSGLNEFGLDIASIIKLEY